ncbi:transglycosylase domain-containing protein [Asanoa sp. WMMD1127]|uniref:transglycosylase domain-containing protein n=1 Tax=Asanoa sp. WMMD1127 TaxID=3016107 RepID=UPI002416925D|nr:transglycosylase domain-containing protein [Asanoa sp. WMMD1127]MDG4822144.1 transglycosylase domain-containing protein [Asanoa sp. WMMD1127]
MINWAIAGFAVMVILAGAGLVGGTYYTTNVVVPENVSLPLASTIYAADGKTQIAKLGEYNRTFVSIEQIPDFVQKAVAAAEDRKFYEHDGVDYVGIARAAWNNFTGGERQGASTITQQYARNAYDNLEGATYARKVREAVMASKLNDEYSKDQIMQMYLNTIYFGRGAYGIEAAAQTYFGKSVSKLNVAEGAVLAAVIKQPQPSATHKGFDPGYNLPEAQSRWTYVINGMVEKGWLKAEEKPASYPDPKKAIKPLPKDGTCFTDCGVNTPLGNVINYVRDEMIAMKIPGCDAENCSQLIKDGGFKIQTTINIQMQRSMEAAIWRKKKGSELAGQPSNLMAAGVAVEPETGRVLAYFGGENGTGHDYAGKNVEGGALTGGHAPGSSFKIYTLAAALESGISLDSRWDATDYEVPGTEIKVINAGRQPPCGKNCTLRTSTIESYNVPFFHITEKIGTDKVVEMARNAGVTTMWTNNPVKPYNIASTKTKIGKSDPFYYVAGYGAYPITVLDHANGLATITNRGVYNKAHFVISVQQKNDAGQWIKVGGEQRKPRQTIRPEVADDVNDTLEKISGGLDGGRPATGKTGTWELNEKSSDNAHAWMLGATKEVATAIWVGNVGKEKAIRDKNENKIAGAGLPKDIWKRFMNEALDGKPITRFPPGTHLGDPDAGNGTQPQQPTCFPGQDCNFPGGNAGGNGNGNGNGNGGNGNGDGRRDDNNTDQPQTQNNNPFTVIPPPGG